MEKRPNILFIMTDEQRHDAIGYRNPVVQTPNIDKIAKEGIIFNNGYCSNPSCVPSRAAIVTGKYPSECKCPTYISQLPENERTFMSLLRQAGYYTGVVGKQHFGDSKVEKGYDYEEIIDGHGPMLMNNNDHQSSYKDFCIKEGVKVDELYTPDHLVGGTWKGDFKYYIDYYIGERGKKWIREKRTEDKPWFMCLSFPGPHQPFDCHGTKYEKMYQLEDIQLPETTIDDLEDKPPHFKKMNPKAIVQSEEELRKTIRAYYANMTLIDEKIGEVIEELKAIGEYDNTMIIYTADHGDFMGDFGMVTKSQYLTEGLMRVPLFVKPPLSYLNGIMVDDLVLNIDIASTCLKVAGVSIPEDISNFNYTSYWTDEERKTRDYIFTEAQGMKAVRDDEWKLVFYLDRPYGELYNLKKDPIEKYNLWDDEKYLDKKSYLQSILLNHIIKMLPHWDRKWNKNSPEI